MTAQHADLGHCLGRCGNHELVLPYLDAPTGSSVSLVIPASNIALSRAPVTGISIQNQIPGIVAGIRTVCHRALVTMNIGTAEQPTTILAEITEKSVHDLHIEINDTLYCLFKAQAVRHLGDTSR